MLKQALGISAAGICALGMLLLATAAAAQDPGVRDAASEAGETDDGDIVELRDPAAMRAFSRDGWYVQLAYTHGFERKLADKLEKNGSQVPPPAGPTGAADVSNSPGVNMRFGRRVHPNIAVELQTEYMPAFDVSITGAPDVGVEMLGFTVNLKFPFEMPLPGRRFDGRLQPYALLGGGAMWAFPDNRFPERVIPPPPLSNNTAVSEEIVDARGAGPVFRLGGGLDVYLTRHIALSVEGTWVATQGQKLNDLRYWALSTGVAYRF